jgi:TrmH family RNA methyltransferase
MSSLITSAANPVVKRVRLLADRRHRRREGAFVVEGIQPVWRAVEAGWEIETLIVVPELLVGSPAEAMVADQEARGVGVARLSRELFERLSDREGPPGLAAIVRGRVGALSELTVTPDAMFVALHQVGNPGNLGTIIRTVDAAGGAGVILLGDGTDPYAPAAVKASMGSVFAVPVASARESGEFFAWAADHGVSVVTTSGYAAAAHWDVRYKVPVAVLLGSEGDGLPADLLARGDVSVKIPMTGTAESLNLAVAAALMMYEVRRHQLPEGSP